MKDCKPIKSVILFLLLYPTVLGANIRAEVEAFIKATTNKGEGILARVDTVLMKKWKAVLKFKWYRSIRGENKFEPLEDEFGPFHLFDISATPGIWYEYKVMVQKGNGAPFFLSTPEPVVGYRPPSSMIPIPAQFELIDIFQYRGEVYFDFYFKDASGAYILPKGAVYHAIYDTQEEKEWMFDLGNGALQPVHGEEESKKSRIKIKKLPGMQTIDICIRMIQNGRLSRFFCKSLDLTKLPNKRPKDIALLQPARPNLHKGTSGKRFILPNRNRTQDPFKEHRRLAKLIPFSDTATRRQSQKQRIIRRVS